jgi:hypothetical protein
MFGPHLIENVRDGSAKQFPRFLGLRAIMGQHAV